MTPLVSIVIPVYNGANYMRCAIDSALSQTYENCEVIVVNDGSDDGGETDRIARSYGERIRYFAKENGGVATALNCGVENMRGEYFSWLSHDDYYLPCKVRRQMDTLRELPPETILLGGYTLLYTETNKMIPVKFYPMYTERQLAIPLFPVFAWLANGCTMMIHKSNFDRVGLFNPKRKTTQDYEMWYRMFRNANVRYSDTCDVVMRQHPMQGSKTIVGNIAEAEDLWIWMDEQTKDYERAQIAGTPERFYRFVYSRIHACYPLAAQYYLAREQEEKRRWNGRDMSDAERLTAALIQNINDGYVQNENMKIDQSALPLDKRIGRTLYFNGISGTVKKITSRITRR